MGNLGNCIKVVLSVFQHISHSPELLSTSLGQLSGLLKELSPFLNSPQDASKSVLLQEIGPLSNMADAIKSPSTTPVLHRLVAVNSFIQLFVNLSRSCQAGYNVSQQGDVFMDKLPFFVAIVLI